jgi:protocatechuate 3,4-dioxygenase beta subunit
MPNSLARVTFVALAFAAACAAWAGTCAAQAAAKEAPATVTGRVTNGEKGMPGVEVVLTAPDPTSNYKAAARGVTDAEGRFRLANVAPGRYQLLPIAPAHVTPELTGWPPGKPVTLVPGDTVEDMNFALTRGGVITGRVTDSEGKPVIGEQVNITPADKGVRALNFFAGQRNTTDDRGVYRAYGLAAGRYRVSVGQDRNSGMIRVGGPRRFYRRTFHPDASEEAQAKIVEVREGGEATEIDISVAKASRTYKAEGRFVSAETGRPMPGLQFAFGSIMGEGAGRRVGSYGSSGQRSNASGEFVADELPPGSYAVFAVSDEGVDWYSDTAVVEIEDADVTGLEIKIRRGSSLSGVVQIEGVKDRAAYAKLLEQVPLARNVESRGDLAAPNWSRIVIAPDGSFRVGGLRPGKLRLMLGWPPVKGLSLVRVDRENVEQRDGIDIAEGANVTGVRVLLAYGNAVIRGQVNVTGGALPQGVRMIVSARRAGAAPPGWAQMGMQPAEVDTRGRFTIEGVAAGEYELQLRLFGPGYMNVQPLKQAVTVPEGGETPVTFALNLGALVRGGDTP